MTDGIITVAEERKYIAGEHITLQFEVLRENGLPVHLDLADTQIIWTLCMFGHPDAHVIQKKLGNDEGITVSNPTNQFDVNLNPPDTEDLDGLYTYQITIIDPDGIYARRITGDMYFIPANK